jgi:hypothetical protein
MAVKYSVGLSAAARDRSLLKRRRASSARASSTSRVASDDESLLEMPRKRGWLLLTQDADVDEPNEPSASWAW